jgi:hypothetical protein
MSSHTFRTIATALIFAALVSLAAPPPAQAWLPGRRSFDGPTREVRERGFFSRLLRLFDFTGGAMDPNGNS